MVQPDLRMLESMQCHKTELDLNSCELMLRFVFMVVIYMSTQALFKFSTIYSPFTVHVLLNTPKIK